MIFTLTKPRMTGRNISYYLFACVDCCLFSARCLIFYIFIDLYRGLSVIYIKEGIAQKIIFLYVKFSFIGKEYRLKLVNAI